MNQIMLPSFRSQTAEARARRGNPALASVEGFIMAHLATTPFVSWRPVLEDMPQYQEPQRRFRMAGQISFDSSQPLPQLLVVGQAQIAEKGAEEYPFDAAMELRESSIYINAAVAYGPVLKEVIDPYRHPESGAKIFSHVMPVERLTQEVVTLRYNAAGDLLDLTVRELPSLTEERKTQLYGKDGERAADGMTFEGTLGRVLDYLGACTVQPSCLTPQPLVVR